jgi:glutaredoxin
MNKTFKISLVFFVATSVLSIFLLYKDKEIKINGGVENETEMTLFYGEGCPHCLVVEEYLGENPTTKEQIFFTEKEIYSNKENNDQLKRVAQKCNLSQIGVPLFFDGESCYIGDWEIINFFISKIKSESEK